MHTINPEEDCFIRIIFLYCPHFFLYIQILWCIEEDYLAIYCVLLRVSARMEVNKCFYADEQSAALMKTFTHHRPLGKKRNLCLTLLQLDSFDLNWLPKYKNWKLFHLPVFSRDGTGGLQTSPGWKYLLKSVKSLSSEFHYAPPPHSFNNNTQPCALRLVLEEGFGDNGV